MNIDTLYEVMNEGKSTQLDRVTKEYVDSYSLPPGKKRRATWNMLDDVQKQYDKSKYFKGVKVIDKKGPTVGASAVTGALTGAVFGGPIGALGGAIGGAGIGHMNRKLYDRVYKKKNR